MVVNTYRLRVGSGSLDEMEESLGRMEGALIKRGGEKIGVANIGGASIYSLGGLTYVISLGDSGIEVTIGGGDEDTIELYNRYFERHGVHLDEGVPREVPA